MTEWINVPQDISKYQGFVYLISCKTTGKKYVGLKYFWSKGKKKLARKPTKAEKERLDRYFFKDKVKFQEYKKELKTKYKGSKKVVRTRVESDWKDYWSSSNELLKDIEKLGKDNFERRIIHLCETKFDCAYMELIEQIERNVLYDSKYYNQIINVRLRKKIDKK